MTLANRIRKAALGPTPTDSLTALFGYYNEPWVIVKSRLPQHPLMPATWFLATEDVRRMFLLFVAEAIDR